MTSCEPTAATTRNARSSHARPRTSTAASSVPRTIRPVVPPSHEAASAADSTTPGTPSARRSATRRSMESTGSQWYAAARRAKPERPPASAHRACLGVTVAAPAACSGAVAALVLLARAAPARVVPADVLVLVDGLRLDVEWRRRPRRHRGRRARPGRRDHVGPCRGVVLVVELAAARLHGLERRLRLLLDLQRDVEQAEDDVVPDRAAELLEEDVTLAAVLDERILLRERTQVDALTQVVHRLEVLAPALVDDLEDHVALDLAHQLRAELLLPLAVRVERVSDELLDERVPVGRVDALLGQLVERDVGPVEPLHVRDEAREVPLLREVGVRELLHAGLHRLLDPALHLFREVVALEHAAALLVDDHALRVHDVVVLEDVLARDEVLLLDLLLRVLDLLREDPGLHRLVVRDLEEIGRAHV